MIRNVLFVLVALLAAAHADASSAPSASGSTAPTPASSLSSINVFGGTGTAQHQRLPGKYAQVQGNPSQACKDESGKTVDCGTVGQIPPNPTVAGSGGLTTLQITGVALLAVTTVVIGIAGNHNNPNQSVSAH